MTVDAPLLALKARYVFPVAGPPLSEGVVTIRGERIERLGRRADGDGASVVDLGNVALLPGFVNAHTHLEFSDLAAPLGAAGMAFPQWIRAVIAARGRRAVEPRAAIAAGLDESARVGSTTLGDISTAAGPDEVLRAAPLGGVVFREMMGSSPHPVRLEAVGKSPLWRLGASPHAPYTASLAFVAAVVDAARRVSAPVAMHLAESHEELEFLRSGTGPFRELLEERRRWDANAYSLPLKPLDYLRALGKAPRALVVHGNYLDDEELEFVTAQGQQMSVVYCARTHAFFRHARHPLPRLLAAGANVCLGTDSRASNPDLSLLEEMRFVARTFGELSPSRVLELGTLCGARALGLSDEVGTLEPGKLANLVVVPLADGAPREPLAALLHSAEPVAHAWLRGAPWPRR